MSKTQRSTRKRLHTRTPSRQPRTHSRSKAPESALARVSQRSLRVPDLPTPPAVERLLSFEAWTDYGRQLKEHEARLHEHLQTFQLVVGDWYNYGVEHWQRPAEKAAREIGYSRETIQNFAWVARRIPASLRGDDYTFEDYRTVAALDEESERAEWLEKKKENEWSGKELRRQIASARGHEPAPATADEREEQRGNALDELAREWNETGDKLARQGGEVSLAQADVYFDCANALARALGGGR